VKLKSLSPLQLALGISVALHAAALTVRIVDPVAFNRVFHDTPLEVVLVNSRSANAPQTTTALAQHHLQGGGNADQGRASSPLPYTARQAPGEAVEDGPHETLRQQRARQALLLAQVRQQLASLPAPDPQAPDQQAPLSPQETRQRRLWLKQLAEIERQIQRDNAGPKKHFIGPSTREAVYALYYDKLRRAIEDKGTQNFPVSASGQKLYGQLTMAVTVNFDGRLIDTQVVQSSGNRTLDRRAEAIARTAAPFGRFSQAMRAQADQIVVVSRFNFQRDDTLQTRIGGAP
jgi:protein TonB